MKDLKFHHRYRSSNDWFGVNRLVFEGPETPAAPDADVEASTEKSDQSGVEKPKSFEDIKQDADSKVQELINKYEGSEDGDEYTDQEKNVVKAYQDKINAINKKYEGLENNEEGAAKLRVEIDNLINEIKQRITEETSEKEKPDESSETRKYSEKAIDGVKNIFNAALPEFKKEHPEMEKMIPAMVSFWEGEEGNQMAETLLSVMTDDQIKQIEEGKDLPIDKEIAIAFLKNLKKKLGMENLSGKNEEEINLINKLKLNGESVQDIFGKEMTESLSRSYLIQEEEGVLTIDGKEIKQINDLQPFIKYANATQFNLALKNKHPTALKEIKRNGDTFNSLLKSLSEHEQKLGEAESKKGEKPKSELSKFMDKLAPILQMIGMLKQALAEVPPDMTTLQEAMDDLGKKPPRYPNEVMEQNKKDYRTILDQQNPSFDTLIKAFNEPRGDVATGLFTAENAEAADIENTEDIGRYLNILQPVIQQYLVEKTDMNNISSMKKNPETNMIEVSGYNKQGQPITLELKLDGTAGRVKPPEGGSAEFTPLNNLNSFNSILSAPTVAQTEKEDENEQEGGDQEGEG